VITGPGEIVEGLKRAIAATEAGQPALREFITSEKMTTSAG
jgi:hypothetical protein